MSSGDYRYGSGKSGGGSGDPAADLDLEALATLVRVEEDLVTMNTDLEDLV